jgi:hypothetical protein
VASGGLSHQVHGERAGFNNPAWGARFLDMFENDPQRLTEMTQAEYAELDGLAGAEVIMWLTMRGALSSQVRKLYQSYYLPSIHENLAAPAQAGEIAQHQAHSVCCACQWLGPAGWPAVRAARQPAGARQNCSCSIKYDYVACKCRLSANFLKQKRLRRHIPT